MMCCLGSNFNYYITIQMSWYLLCYPIYYGWCDKVKFADRDVALHGNKICSYFSAVQNVIVSGTLTSGYVQARRLNRRKHLKRFKINL